MQFAYHMVLAAVILFCCNVYDDGSQKLLSIHFLLLFGDLFLINVSYSSCACLIPVSPVTVFTVTKGSFNRLLNCDIVFSYLLRTAALCAKAAEAILSVGACTTMG